jgi:predicted PurR-regulated permease PerM
MAKAVLFPIVLAIVLYFLLNPVSRSLGRLNIPSVLSAAIVVLGGLLILGVGIYFLYLPASEMIDDLPKTLRQADRKLWIILKPLDDVSKASSEISKFTQGKDENGRELQQVQVRQPPLTYVVFTLTGGFVGGGMVVVILLFLLLALGHRTLNSIIELIPGIGNKQGVVRLLRNVEASISRYLVTVTVINAALGVVIGSLMALLGMPDPILIGIMAAALNFVPYLGCMVGTTITFLIAVVALPTPAEAILPPLLYLTINSLEGSVLTPMILGKRMSMNPVLVFLSLVVWGWLWGIGGALIAVPVLGITAIACSHFESLQPVARFISGVSRLESG